MKFDNLTTKKLLEVAGVDTTKGKAKLLIEADMSGGQINPKIPGWLDQLGVKNYKFNNGKIDVDGDVRLQINRPQLPGPVKFGNVTGNFIISASRLTSLRGCPDTVGENFICSHNDLESLEGGPRQVGGSYSAIENPLESVQGIAQQIGGTLWLPETMEQMQGQIRKMTRAAKIRFEGEGGPKGPEQLKLPGM